jgi:acyl-CoA thioesterase-1
MRYVKGMIVSRMPESSQHEWSRPAAWRSALAALLALAVLALAPVAARAEITILAFGDSLTAGAGLPEAEGFVPQLEGWLHRHGQRDVRVVNAGVSGDTSAGGLARIDWALTPEIDGVIVELGANDMLRGLSMTKMRANLDGILDRIDARGLPALLAGLPAPPNYPKDYQKAFKDAFRELAEKHQAIYVNSFFAGMSGRGMKQVMAMMQPDGLHPNAKGVAANVEAIGPSVLKLVKRARVAAKERG